MLHVDAVSEADTVDELRWDVRTQAGLFLDQLLQAPRRERVLGADEHGAWTQRHVHWSVRTPETWPRPRRPNTTLDSSPAVFDSKQLLEETAGRDPAVRSLTRVQAAIALQVLRRQAQLQAQLRLPRSALSCQLGDAPCRQAAPQQRVQQGAAQAEPQRRRPAAARCNTVTVSSGLNRN